MLKSDKYECHLLVQTRLICACMIIDISVLIDHTSIKNKYNITCLILYLLVGFVVFKFYSVYFVHESS